MLIYYAMADLLKLFQITTRDPRNRRTYLYLYFLKFPNHYRVVNKTRRSARHKNNDNILRRYIISGINVIPT